MTDELCDRHSKTSELDGGHSKTGEVDGRPSKSTEFDTRPAQTNEFDGRHSKTGEFDGRHSKTSEFDGRHSKTREFDGRHTLQIVEVDGLHSKSLNSTVCFSFTFMLDRWLRSTADGQIHMQIYMVRTKRGPPHAPYLPGFCGPAGVHMSVLSWAQATKSWQVQEATGRNHDTRVLPPCVPMFPVASCTELYQGCTANTCRKFCAMHLHEPSCQRRNPIHRQHRCRSRPPDGPFSSGFGR